MPPSSACSATCRASDLRDRLKVDAPRGIEAIRTIEKRPRRRHETRRPLARSPSSTRWSVRPPEDGQRPHDTPPSRLTRQSHPRRLHLPLHVRKRHTPEAPIGPEPFVPEPCKRNVSISVKALGHVHEEPTPGVVGVGLIIYADETLRYDTLEAGDVDLIEYVPRQSFDAAEANPGPDAQDIRRPVRVPPPQRRRRPVRRPEGRQAVGYGIQRQDVIDAAFTGRGEPPTSVAPTRPARRSPPPIPHANRHSIRRRPRPMLAKAGNLGGFPSERIDDLLDRGRAELHPEACRAIPPRSREGPSRGRCRRCRVTAPAGLCDTGFGAGLRMPAGVPDVLVALLPRRRGLALNGPCSASWSAGSWRQSRCSSSWRPSCFRSSGASAERRRKHLFGGKSTSSGGSGPQPLRERMGPERAPSPFAR